MACPPPFSESDRIPGSGDRAWLGSRFTPGLSLGLGLTWGQIHLVLRFSPGEGGSVLRSRFQLRIRVGWWVRGHPRAGAEVWDTPCTVSPVSLPVPSLRGAVHTTATRPAGAMTQSPRPHSRHPPCFSSPSAEWVAGALHSSPTGSGMELPIIVHYCWQLPSLAGLRGNWPDCRGVGLVAEALPALGTQKLSGQQPQPLGTHSDLDLTHGKPQSWGRPGPCPGD